MTVSRIVERTTQNFYRLKFSSFSAGIYDTAFSINLGQNVSCLRHSCSINRRGSSSDPVEISVGVISGIDEFAVWKSHGKSKLSS
jgi:hypothetical protein